MKNATLIIGRFQPFHSGHAKIVDKARGLGDEVVIVTIERGTLSRDYPFPNSLLGFTIASRYPWAHLMYFKNGNLVECKEIIKEVKGLNVTRILCGPDRFASYDLQSKKYDLDIEVLKIPEIYNIRGTKVREAIKNEDIEEFTRMMGVEDPEASLMLYKKWIQ